MSISQRLALMGTWKCPHLSLIIELNCRTPIPSNTHHFFFQNHINSSLRQRKGWYQKLENKSISWILFNILLTKGTHRKTHTNITICLSLWWLCVKCSTQRRVMNIKIYVYTVIQYIFFSLSILYLEWKLYVIYLCYSLHVLIQTFWTVFTSFAGCTLPDSNLVISYYHSTGKGIPVTCLLLIIHQASGVSNWTD